VGGLFATGRPRAKDQEKIMVTTSKIAEIGSLLGDPARVNMMIALIEGRAFTARELADVGGVSPQTASSHLAKLTAAKMVRVEKQGRHRYHRIASAEVAEFLEQMHILGSSLALSNAPRRGPRDEEMRELRSCYDHLAGRIAVELSDRLIEDQGVDRLPRLKEGAEARLLRLNIDLQSLDSERRPICKTCLDWSERRPHVSGAMGAAILERALELGWIKRRQSSRALILTAPGERGFADVFGVTAVRSMC
jgi:DNA-binding transcriptional ArsR family regulator